VDQTQAQPDEIFCAALELASAERAAYLDRVCRGDVALRRRVERLLEAHTQAGSFLAERPTSAAETTDSVVEGAGALLGPYKLLELIGEGGFGVVFLAEQQPPIRRKVALKVLKPGMDTRHVVARFEAERQALAIMDHPNIARVFDGGATPTGRPYFVMELVKGVSITDYCDQYQLTLRQRLELFVHVCKAAQHAHQKGIIHRDLKPSNVLISRHDTTPVVKVIDFGVAKALGQELTDKTLFTGIAQMIGTPLYMSPEQAGMSDLDIDTRSDIYSLGVLLYELLTGTTPFAKERFKRASYDEIRRIIREEEPPKPSTRLSESSETLVSISARRQTESAKLTKLVRYELDWIVMKALEKDRNRRYETANGFAMDVQRYLADESVLACPPSAWYRFRKFATRNKVALTTAALLATSLVLITAILTVSNVTITHERDQKGQALKEKEAALTQAKHNEAAANDERRRAEENAKLATKVLNEIIMQEASRRVDLFRKDKAKRVSLDAGREKQEIDFLKKGLTFYEQLAQTNSTALAARREKARAYRQVGWLQHVLGKEEESVQAFRQAIRLWEQLAAESPGDFDSQYRLADAWHWLFSVLWNQHLLHDADAANRRARELFDKLAEQYPKDPRCLEGRADCQLHWAYVLMKTQRLTEANDVLLRCRALWQECIHSRVEVAK
jgi:serine/threonine protein kinase